jgi:hypothetical protein
MLGAFSYDDIRRQLALAFSTRYAQGATRPVNLTGILFAPPRSSVGAEIVPRLDDYHHRSANDVDFFLPGYGAYWPEGWVQDEQEVAVTTNRANGATTRWLYSAHYFDRVMREIREAAPGWHYSGESDLLLADAIYDEPTRTASIDFTTAVVLKLHLLARDGAVETVAELFERIFTFAEQRGDHDPTWRFSDRSGVRVGASWLESLVTEALPLSLGKVWKAGRHFVVRDLTRR